jgi:hypothetical protein
MNPSRAFKLLPLVFGFVSCAWLGEPKTLNETRVLDLNGITKLEVLGIAENFSVTRGDAAGLRQPRQSSSLATARSAWTA